MDLTLNLFLPKRRQKEVKEVLEVSATEPEQISEPKSEPESEPELKPEPELLDLDAIRENPDMEIIENKNGKEKVVTLPTAKDLYHYLKND